jgi:hypothetical protein
VRRSLDRLDLALGADLGSVIRLPDPCGTTSARSNDPPAKPGAFDTGAAQSGWPPSNGGRFALEYGNGRAARAPSSTATVANPCVRTHATGRLSGADVIGPKQPAFGNTNSGKRQTLAASPAEPGGLPV